MITTKDQEELFRLIADYIRKDIQCLAIGGTAMMFKNYKTATKDIDLVFHTEDDRTAFIKAIQELGYKEISLREIYDDKRVALKNKPLLFTRGDERFDLFVKDVFGFTLSFESKTMTQRHDFIGKKELNVYVPSPEMLVLLKAITRRSKDMEDIVSIIKIEKNLNWKKIITDAVAQRKNKQWILYDLEQTMQELKKITFIPQSYFDILYKGEEKKS